MHDLELIVNSCDAYADVWAPFFHALRANWEGAVPPIVLNCESKEYSLEGLRIRRPPTAARAGGAKDDWGGRLLAALAEARSEYILMVFDDAIPEGPIDVEEIGRCVERLAADPGACAFYLVNPFLRTRGGGEGRFAEVAPRSDYILNSAPGVWRKADLERFVKAGDNPWAWEYFGSARLIVARKRAYVPREGAAPVFPYRHELGGAIYRGKWVAGVIEPALAKYGLELDLSARGVIEPQPVPHGFGWKVKFFLAGFRMVGFGALALAARALLRKLPGRGRA